LTADSTPVKKDSRALLLLANFGNEGEPEAVIPKISQEVLADMIGTTRSRVSFFVNKFRRLGFIDYNGTIQGTPFTSECCPARLKALLAFDPLASKRL
jgi:hypothetical protein